MIFRGGGFRRSASERGVGLLNVTVAAAVGYVSALYIWKEPLERYWQDRDPQTGKPKDNSGR